MLLEIAGKCLTRKTKAKQTDKQKKYSDMFYIVLLFRKIVTKFRKK